MGFRAQGLGPAIRTEAQNSRDPNPEFVSTEHEVELLRPRPPSPKTPKHF